MEEQIPDNSIDMILADLPYGTTACKWDSIIPLEPLWEQYKRVIKDNGAIVLTASQPFTSKLVMNNIEWFRYEWIWRKTMATLFQHANKMPMKKHENILVFYKKIPTYNPQFDDGEPYIDIRKENYRKKDGFLNNKVKKTPIVNEGKRYPTSLSTKFSNSNHNNKHPTQKPVALFEYLIKTYTNENEIVLDNVIGSGTTAVACLKTNRKFIGFEKEEKYYNIALKRIGKFDKSYYEELPESEKPEQKQLF